MGFGRYPVLFPVAFSRRSELCDEVIYTSSSLVEQSTPSEHLIFDATATVGGRLVDQEHCHEDTPPGLSPNKMGILTTWCLLKRVTSFDGVEQVRLT